MSTDDRTAALASVRRAIEEWRKALDVLLRVTAALKNGPDAGAVKSVAEELREARRKAASAARDAQRRVDAALALVEHAPPTSRAPPTDLAAGARVPVRRPPPLPRAAMPPLPPPDDEPVTERTPATGQGDEP